MNHQSSSPPPLFIRVPKPGTKCPYTGLSRSAIWKLIGGKNPPVDSISIGGAKRGTRLINLASLLDYLITTGKAKGAMPASLSADAPEYCRTQQQRSRDLPSNGAALEAEQFELNLLPMAGVPTSASQAGIIVCQGPLFGPNDYSMEAFREAVALLSKESGVPDFIAVSMVAMTWLNEEVTSEALAGAALQAA